jgi:hypothetical protein
MRCERNAKVQMHPGKILGNASGLFVCADGRSLGAALSPFLEALAWWAEAAKAQRARREPPY